MPSAPDPIDRPVSRARRLVSGILATAVTAAIWAVLPTPEVGAAGDRSVSVSVDCTDRTPSVGVPTDCTVQVDDNASGTKVVPTGTVTLAVASPASRVGSVVPLGTCSLAANSNRRSGCTVPVLAVAASVTGQATVLRASFTPDNPSPHRAGSGTRNLTVSGISTPVVYSPSVTGFTGTGDRLAEVRLYVPGCTSGTGSAFVADSADENPPNSAFTIKGWERSADSFGAFSFVGSAGADQPTGVFRTRFTCSTGSAGAVDAANVTWTSPVFTYTVTSTANLQAVRADGPETGTAVAAAPSASTWSVDPEGLPLVDRFGIHGPEAALLKAQVDAVRPATGTVGRLAWAALGRMPARSVYDRWVPQVPSKGTWGLERELERTPEFVSWFALATDEVFLQRAYSRTLGRWPTAAERDAAIRRLRTQGVPRVRILAELAETPVHRQRVAVRDDVLAAYLAITPVVPTATELSRFEAMTRAIVLRVQVIEEIALTRAPAERWTAALAVPGARPRF